MRRLSLFLFVLVWATALLAQTTAEILGTVADESGASIPGAKITARNTATGIVSNTTSGDGGQFRFPLLQPGKYEVTIEKSGFAKLIRSNVEIQLNERANIPAQLKVSATQEVINVTGEVPLINTTNSEVGVNLQSDDRSGLIVLSTDYQEKLRGLTVTCADYVLDPDQEIDRYQVWFSNGTSLCHDFKLRDEDYPMGMAYTATNQDFTAAATLVDTDGVRHYVVAKGGFYTHETQPSATLANRVIPTTDQTFANAVDQTVTDSEINGEYRFNWDSFGDWNERKKLAGVFVVGDGAVSTALAGASPIALKWWGDFEQVPGTPNTVAPAAIDQTSTAWQYRFAPLRAHRFLYKLGFTLSGHSTDDSDFHNHRRPAEEGDLDLNFYGSICDAAFLLGDGGNRP